MNVFKKYSAIPWAALSAGIAAFGARVAGSYLLLSLIFVFTPDKTGGKTGTSLLTGLAGLAALLAGRVGVMKCWARIKQLNISKPWMMVIYTWIILLALEGLLIPEIITLLS